ncbi:MAG: hypothetical protein AAF402_12510 [Pseudomonadota bacterium]
MTAVSASDNRLFFLPSFNQSAAQKGWMSLRTLQNPDDFWFDRLLNSGGAPVDSDLRASNADSFLLADD